MKKGAGWGWVLLAAVLVGVVYARLLQCGFLLYDDPDYVTANKKVFAGLTVDSFRWAFTASHACNWHPLTWLSHMLDVQLYGFTPAGHHLTSLILHVANFVLLATVLWRLTEAFGPSLLVALLFALHPLHVESVAWVAERKDVLSGFFWLLTIHLYTTYARRGGIWRYTLTLLCFSFGLMAKPMVVTLPLILLLLDYWPLYRFNPGVASPPAVSPRFLLAEKVPFFILSAVVSVVTYLTQSGGGAVDIRSLTANGGNAVISYVTYLLKMCIPTRLAFFYPYQPETVTLPRVAAAALVLVAISLLVIRAAPRRRYLAAGWFWYLVTLLPVIGFIRVGDQAMADRYTYLPLVGVFIMIVWGAGDPATASPRRNRMVWGVAVPVLLVLAALTWRQTGFWRNGLALNRHALQVTDANWSAHNNLGGELNLAGDVEGAIVHYREAIRLFPGYEGSYYNLGKIYLSLDQPAEAVELFRKAVACKPNFADGRRYLGFTWLLLGRVDLALEEYRRLNAIDGVAAAALLNSIKWYGRKQH